MVESGRTIHKLRGWWRYLWRSFRLCPGEWPHVVSCPLMAVEEASVFPEDHTVQCLERKNALVTTGAGEVCPQDEPRVLHQTPSIHAASCFLDIASETGAQARGA